MVVIWTSRYQDVKKYFNATKCHTPVRTGTQSMTNDSAIGEEWLGECLIQDTLGAAVVVAQILLEIVHHYPGCGLSWQQGCWKSQLSFASHLVEHKTRTNTFKLLWSKPEAKGSQFPRCLVMGSVHSIPATFFPSPTALPNKVATHKSSPHRAQHRLRNSLRIWTHLQLRMLHRFTQSLSPHQPELSQNWVTSSQGIYDLHTEELWDPVFQIRICITFF